MELEGEHSQGAEQAPLSAGEQLSPTTATSLSRAPIPAVPPGLPKQWPKRNKHQRCAAQSANTPLLFSPCFWFALLDVFFSSSPPPFSHKEAAAVGREQRHHSSAHESHAVPAGAALCSPNEAGQAELLLRSSHSTLLRCAELRAGAFLHPPGSVGLHISLKAVGGLWVSFCTGQ